ncbi:Signal transduction histidine kinase [Reichenbachiella faecimaris]|uniref:histidine kinase n=1 Tax=Reichenbachiella faecimaris TaxID=692418 RepID=A0A1W2GHR3_REIFA|nr:HAMP domain-containing sensor histidine kinase [Reichenbachiella faecimaris]SMD36195.1 Signal transduction histidine kinase [Reichenbachiella faecimaris]
MQKKALTVRAKYTLGGVIFGLSFPVFSQLMDCWLNGMDFSLKSILIIHQNNVIHYVVDTAPLVLGMAGFLLGVTHQKKNDINQRLSGINESLDTLTYKITHDLRGPALNIKNLSEILKTSSIPESKKREVIDKVHESVDTWLQTFEDFMSLLKHEKSGDLEKKECSLEEAIENLKQVLAHDIEESGVKINTDFTEISSVYASEVYLNSILKNLITNAIKYAHPDRQPEINIKAVPKGSQVQLVFSDNGSGIDLATYGDKLFTLFERFSSNSRIPGSGIGLYLVKEQIEKNNGTIEVQSIPNEGTIFTIHLPITA